jgi:ABC-2 type transport system ATP-binding protein
MFATGEVSAMEPCWPDSIILNSVHKRFRKGGFFFPLRAREETRALNGISLNIAAGEVFGLLGPNGSGKSTTLKLISTVLLPDAGHVVINGVDTQVSAEIVRKYVGLAMASERSFFPRLTARENLEFFAAFEDVLRRETRSRVNSALEQVGLCDQGKKLVMKFSSGMVQRLAIARALIKQPSVLLLDEPSRSLDPAAAERLWELIRNLSHRGMTIVLASHNFEEAAAVCDRVAVLQHGELLAIQRVSNWSTEQLRDFYLELTREQSDPLWTEGVPA